MNACRESAKTTERILAAMLLMFVALLVSCGGKTDDLTGNWVQSNSNSKTSAMIAVIADEEIAVYWYNASNQVSALYWAGTYKKPSSAGDWSWDSQANKEKNGKALLASPDASKKFSYSAKDDKISFEVALQGNTYTVEMLRVPETSSSSGSSAASSSSSASSSPASAPSSASSSGSQAGPAALGYEIYDDDLAIAERGYSYDDGTLDYAIKVVNTSSQTTYKYAQVTVSAYDEGGKVLGTSKDAFTEAFPATSLPAQTPSAAMRSQRGLSSGSPAVRRRKPIRPRWFSPASWR